MKTAARLALPFLLMALGSCGGRGGIANWIGLGDPLRMAAQDAPFDFGDTRHLAGRPAAAAETAARIEWFAHAAETDPLWSTPRNATLQPQLQIARQEMRQALGISPGVRPEVAILALGSAAEALRHYDRASAEAALSVPGFQGGAATLARLSALPRLPRVEEAAQAVAIEVNQPSSRGR
jgi:hypothetical protein